MSKRSFARKIMSAAMTIMVFATALPVNTFAETDILPDETASDEVSEDEVYDIVGEEVSDLIATEDDPAVPGDDSEIYSEINQISPGGAGPAGSSYISPLTGAYYINGGTVKLNGLKSVENYKSDFAKLHTAIYEDQMYEYHGGKIYIGNEVILPGSELPKNATVTDTAADAEGKDSGGETVTPVDHASLVFNGSDTYVYTLKDIPVEVLSCFDPKDYNDLNQNYADVTFPKNYKFYAWEYEKDTDGYYTRTSVTEIPSADISWDESAYVSREDNDGNGSDVYSFSGCVRLSPDNGNPIAIVAFLYDAWADHLTAEYRKGDDEIVNAIGQIEYSSDRSSFLTYSGCGVLSADDEDVEAYRPIRERVDHFTDGFSLYPFYYHKDPASHRLTLYGFQSRMGQFMSGYSDLSVDDYYLDTLRIPAKWTDPDTSVEYDVAIASITDGACSIDPGYAGTVIISEGVAFPDDCSELFGLGSMYLQNFIIEGDPASVGSNITDMSDMFSYSHNIYSTPLNTVDIAALDTSGVTDMSHMFEGVEVSSLDISHFDVSHVTDFSYMFYDCAAMSLDVGGWEAGKSTGTAPIDLSHMFEGEGQFNEGSRLKRGVAAMGQLRGTLDLSGFKFDYVTDMSNMFANQGYITKIIFPGNINTSRVTDMKYLFSSCSGLTEIQNIEKFNTSSVTDMGGMFGAWNVPAFIETRAGDYSGPWLYELMDMTREDAVDTFSGTKSQNDGPALTSLNLSGWNTSKVKNMAGMFSMPNLTMLTLSENFHTEQVRNMNGMFTFPVMTDTDFLSYISIRDARLANMMIDMPLATSLAFKSIDLSKISDTTYYLCYWSVYAPQVTELDLSEAVLGTAKGSFGEDTFRYMNGLSLIKLPAGMPQFNYPPVMPVTYYDEDGNEYPTLPGGNRKALTLTNSENYLKDVALRAVLVYDGETHEYVADASEDTVVIYHWGTGEYSEGDYNTFRNEYPDAVSLELVTDPENPNPEPKIKWEVLSQDPDQAGNWVIDPRLINNETGTWIEIVNDSRFTTGTAIVRVTINDDIVYDCNIEVCNSPYTTSGSSGSQKELTGTKDGNRYLCRVLGDGTVSVLRLKTANATSVDLTGGVGGYTVSEIGSFAFDGASSVTGIKLGSSVKKLGSHAFCNCSGLKTFEAPGLEEIGVYAFYNCYQLYEGSAFNSVSSVKKVGDKAFRGCAFSSVDLSNATTLGKSVFMECASLSELTLDNEKLTAWGDNILAGEELSDTQITSFTVPDCITQIGYLDNNDYFGSPFPTCIEELNFGSNVTVLGDYALAGMRALKRINSDTDGVANIPSTVTAIGSNAFKDWNALIHELTIPASVTSIGQEAFYGGGTDEGKGLYNVTFTGTLDTVPYRMFYGNKSIKSVTIPDLSEGAEVSEEAFKDCDVLETLIIDDEITAVGKYAFYGCENLEKINAAGGRNVNFLTKAVTIGDNAFEDCESLGFGSIILPAAKTIGQRAFDGCDRLTSISLPKAETLGDYAFEFCKGLTSIIFSENIKKLGSQMIEGTAVTSVDLSMATGLTELERFSLGTSDPYNRPSHLTEVDLPDSLKVIGLNALINTSELTSINLPEGLTAIENGAFAGSGLTSLTIPDSVKIISGRDHTAEYDNHVTESGKGAFEDCSSLTEVHFGSGLEIIGNSAFMNCTGLTSIDMSGTAVRVIGSNAFYRSGSYSRITELRLSDATQSIGYGAFNSLSNGITSMRLPSSLKEMGCHEGIDWAYPVFGTTFDRLILPLGMKEVGTDSFAGDSYNGGNTVLIEIPYTVTNIDGLKCNGIMKKTFDQGEIESNGGKEYLGLIVYGGTETEWNRLVDTYNLTQSYPQDWSKFHILFNAGWTRGANGIPKYVPYDFSKFYPTYTAGDDYDPSTDESLNVPASQVVSMDGAYYYFNASGRMAKDTAILFNGKISECYRATAVGDEGYVEGRKYGNFYPADYASAGLYYFNEDGTGTPVQSFGTASDSLDSQVDSEAIADGIYTHPNDPSARFIIRDHSLLKGSNPTVLVSELILKDGSIYHAGKNGMLTVGYTESPVRERIDGKDTEVTYGWYFDASGTEDTGKLIWYSRTPDGETTYYVPHTAGAASAKAAITASDADALNGDYPDEEGQNVTFSAGSAAGLADIRLFGAATKTEAEDIDVSVTPGSDRSDLVIPEGSDSTEYILRLVTTPTSPAPVPDIEWSVVTNAPKKAGDQVLSISEDPDDDHFAVITASNPGRSRVRVTVKSRDTEGNILKTYEKECLFVITDTHIYPTGLTITSSTGDKYVSPGGTLTLNAVCTPENANTDTDIIWKSSNKNVATVTADAGDSGKAVVTGIKGGSAVIQAICGNAVRAGFTVTCADPVAITGIRIVNDTNKSTIITGDTLSLKAVLSPEEATGNVTWSSDKPDVATVDQTGLVAGVAPGKAVITAKAGNGVKATYNVTVEAAPVSDEMDVTGVTLNKNSVSLYPGESFKLSVTINPAGAGDKSVTWTSSDTSQTYVKLDTSTGKVTAVRAATDGSGDPVPATVTITATANGAASGTTVKAECIVTVLPSEIVEKGADDKPITPAAGQAFVTEDDGKGEARIWAAGLDNTGYYYTGNAIKPEIHVYKGYKLLTEKTDYTLSYKNNKNVSKGITEDKKKPRIIIKMKGDYSGSETVYFNIIPMPLENLTADNDVFSTEYKAGKKNLLKPSLMYNGNKVKYGAKDIAFKWFTTDETGEATDIESNCTEPGTYAVKVFAGESGNYSGGASGHEVAKIIVSDKVPMSKVKLTGFKGSLPYAQGKAVSQNTVLTYKDKSGEVTLNENVDYTAEYRDNYDLGIATVTYEAVKDESGKYTGQYSGKVIKTYKITGKYTLRESGDGKNCMISLNALSYPYANAAIKPEIKVTATITNNDGIKETRTLVQGRDYTVSYKNNKAVAAADAKKNGKDIAPQVIIKGKGSYVFADTKDMKKGVVKRFEITKPSLTSLVLTISDIAYNKSADRFKKTKILFTDKNYRDLKLKLNKDYTAEFSTSDKSSTPAAGQVVTVTLTATENSSYTGTVTGSYRITDKNNHTDISKAKVAVNPGANGKTQACTFTGSGIEPVKDGNPGLNITVGSGKNLKILTPKAEDGSGDYEIIGYYNNVLPGNNAVILIRGIGNYRGIRAVKFKISARGVNSRWGGIYGQE